MEVPTTPTKKGDHVNEVARELNAKWSLDLPIRDRYSPSKIEHNTKEEKIYKIIRFLCFKDQESLDQAVGKFHHEALESVNNWFLARSSDGPARVGWTRSGKGTGISKRRKLTDSEVATLTEKLFEFLSKAQADYHAGSGLQRSPRSGGAAPPSPPAPHASTENTQKPWIFRRLTDYFSSSPANPPSPPQSTAQSTDYGVFDPNDFEDLPMLNQGVVSGASLPQNIPHLQPLETNSIALNGNDGGGADGYTTAPSTPSQRPPSFSDTFAPPSPSPVFRKPARPEPKQLEASRKRSNPESDNRSLSAKPFRPHNRTEMHGPPPFLGFRGREISLNRSFGSTTSMDSMATETSFTRTAASTSFYADTEATSFDSDVDVKDLASLQLLRESGAQAAPFPPYGKRTVPNADFMDIDTGTVVARTEFDDAVDGVPSTQPTIADYLDLHLVAETPFSPLKSTTQCPKSFRQDYELSRFVYNCNLDPASVPKNLQNPIAKYEELWTMLRPLAGSSVLPERSNPKAWDKAEGSWDGVALTGELTFLPAENGPLLGFQLKPLKLETSFRLSRKFGGDRFLVLGLPGLSAGDMPKHLQPHAESVRIAVVNWLVNTEHHILDRRWRAFFVKPQPTTKKTKSSKVARDAARFRVYLFAVNGYDFVGLQAKLKSNRHMAMTVREMLDWFMPPSENRKQPALKFFARLALGVSTTIPTVTFEPWQIIRSDDAFSHTPSRRSLDLARNIEKRRVLGKNPDGVVMNDGCARISKAAAKEIWEKLKINSQMPSAFQGRIGGAKGMWFVDLINETLPGPKVTTSDIWIEITDSQLKFEGHPIDEHSPDPGRVTFDVLSWSTPLSSSALSFQLIPILVDRGVPKDTLEKLLEDDLTAKAAAIEEAMESGMLLRRWMQTIQPCLSERLGYGGIEWQGGLPRSRIEQINWFVEHGYEPKTCKALNDICYNHVKEYCNRLSTRENISVGQSTFAYMIADPLAVLEENEIHIGFSNAFVDLQSGFNNTLLNAIDVLVARLPAHLPSDIQRVKAVFKPELEQLKDVVIFPSKGKEPLADKLSGGDYDGDKAWICWDQALVAKFQNARLPPPTEPEHFGIKKDTTTVQELLTPTSDYTKKFLSKGFDFNLRQQMLGICTIYHEAYCYVKDRSINDSISKTMAHLLGHLVDSAKGGLIFTMETWTDYRVDNELPLKLMSPAYKRKEQDLPWTDHIIDRLVFNVAARVSAKVLARFHEKFQETAIMLDEDLTALWRAEDVEAQEDPELRKVLNHIKAGFEEIRAFWQTNNSSAGQSMRSPRSRNSPPKHQHRLDCQGDDRGLSADSMAFGTLVEQARMKFLAIEPDPSSTYCMIRRWRRDPHLWNRLKASGYFYTHKGHFATFSICGKELGDIKAAAVGSKAGKGLSGMTGTAAVTITAQMHAAMKFDGRFCDVGGEEERMSQMVFETNLLEEEDSQALVGLGNAGDGGGPAGGRDDEYDEYGLNDDEWEDEVIEKTKNNKTFQEGMEAPNEGHTTKLVEQSIPENQLDGKKIPFRPKKADAPKKAPKASKAPKDPAASSKPKKEPKKGGGGDATKGAPTDPESMFKGGFLVEVYQERPKGQNGIEKIITRFPPEPNGYLHIGHSKAIAINFGFAKFHGGDCYLRFDDTNPAGEEEQFFLSIEEMVRWLGFEPVKVTYSSDNFDRLYELAEGMIQDGGAYVCHCTKAEILDQRGGGEGEGRPRYACPHRDRPVEESLTEFRAMRDGKYGPSEAALRMKQDLTDGNPQMWDLFAYRVIADNHHYRTGDKWKIYPTYDYTHCLCDSFEGITHSLCTTEFELSRVSYEWLCDRVKVYKPMQREYGRLNLSGTVLSKRKIIALVEGKHVKAWDDPRLYTLIALRRRGIPPAAILAFVNELGVTKATTNIDIKRFEQTVRSYLDPTVPRLMLVIDPITIKIDNLPDDHLEMVEVPFSKDPNHGVHKVPFTNTVYIERDDFREFDSEGYFRLAPGKSVGLLKVPFPITATSVEKDPSSGIVTVVHAHYDIPPEGESMRRPKSYIHWVGDSPTHNSPINTEVRVFNPLFNSKNPSAHPQGFLADINPDSLKVYPNAKMEIGFHEIKARAPWPAEAGEVAQAGTTPEGEVKEEGKEPARPETVRFQGMRVAYFCVDKETTADGGLVLNSIVSLKEDAGKG
ncbi:hypothetical protein MMC25_007272 [Agyrium rufum]|nr:hypothetical protein [Agyrium rufum]